MPVPVAALERVEPVVDRRSYDGMEELDRVVPDQEVGLQEDARRLRGRRGLEPGQGGDLAEARPVAEDGRCLEQRRRLCRQPREPERDRPADDARPELEKHVCLIGLRPDALAGDRVEQREHEQRVAAGRGLDGGTELLVGLLVEAPADEGGDRPAPATARAGSPSWRSR